MIAASIEVIGSTVNVLNTTDPATSLPYEVYVLNKAAVTGIVAGVCVGLPVLVIICCCIYACTSKSKPAVAASNVDIPQSVPQKNILLQKFCEVKDRTLNGLKSASNPEEEHERMRRRRSTLFSKQNGAEVTPVTSFTNAEESGKKKKKKKKSKSKDKKDSAKEESSSVKSGKSKKSKKGKLKKMKVEKTQLDVIEEVEEASVENVVVESKKEKKKKGKSSSNESKM